MAFKGDGGHLMRAANPNAGTPYKIFVHIIEARGLISGDENHMSDALCVVELGPCLKERRSTTTQHKTMNAIWDQVFMFDDVVLQNHEFQSEKISLSVLHKSDFVRNKLIGTYEFSLGNIYRQKNHQYYRQWVPLAVPEKPENEEGFLQVTVYVLGPNDPTPIAESISASSGGVDESDENASQILHAPSSGEKKMFVLNVLVYRAADVLISQYGGDDAENENIHVAKDIGVRPFVSVRFNGNVLQTTVAASDSLDRTWNRRLELPFSLPLRSDSIEVIMWNKRTGLQDEIIGVKAFNFFQMGLAHKSWGPRWVNMYASDYVSPQTTFLGKIKHYWMSEKTLHKHEYVGKLLMRMSVAASEEALLMSVPCAPVLDPRGDDYTLQFMCHSASELPVLGGKVRVEVVFGTHRVRSAWQFGKAGQSGVFEFFEKFSPISMHIPNDRSQVHHVFVNLYHKVGNKIFKIAFERIPVSSLIPNGVEKSSGSSFYLNGEMRFNKGMKLAHWPCKWRTLHHVHPDRTKAHVSAGFLLASVGFGLKRDYPSTETIPRPTPQSFQKYTLRCYIHQAANLLAALPNGCSNPVLAIRYNGRSLLLPCQQKNTLFPLWFECKEISGLYLDILHAPSVYLMVLHPTTFGYINLGRAEIATEHILKNPNMLCRYRLKYDQDSMDAEGGGAVPGASPVGSNTLAVNSAGHPIIGGQVHTQKNLSDYLLAANASKLTDDLEPYVLASFELFLNKEKEHYPVDSNFPPATKDFVVKVEAIGLRELGGALQDPSLQTELEIAVPRLGFDNTPNTTKPSTTKGPASTTTTGEESTSLTTASGSGGGGGGEPASDEMKEEDLRPRIKWEKQTPSCSPTSGAGIQVLNIATFTRVALPVTDPYSIPMRIRVLNATSSSPKECYCSRFIPVSELLDTPLHIPRPPTYRYSDANSKRNLNQEDTTGQGSMQSGGVIGGGANANSIINFEEEEKESELLNGTLASPSAPSERKGLGKTLAPEMNDIPREYEGLIMHVEEDDEVVSPGNNASEDEDGANQTLQLADDPFTLELDPQALNVGPGTSSEEVKTTYAWKHDGPIKGETAGDDLDEEGLDDGEGDGTPARPKLRNLSLFRNKSSQWLGPSNIMELCILKTYIRCRALPPLARDADKLLNELERDNLIQPIKPLYEKGYMARCYIYTGINLAPLRSFLDEHQSSNPYLVAVNGQGVNHRVSYEAKAKKDDLNPEFFQVFDLPTKIPDNYKLEVQVWNKGFISDDLIGSVWIDLETRLLQQVESQRLAALEAREESFVATTEYHDLKNETARTSQGKVSMKLEMLTEEEARRMKPDDLAPPTSQEYELRMVIWSTRDVRFPQDKDSDGDIDEVNQRVAVTTNFSHQQGREIQKQTDVAWGSAGGHADWFYRMKWRIKVPAKLPRMKIAMWNESVMSDNLLIGECLYNLTPFFAKCMRDKKGISKTEQEWVPFVHPQFRELNLGSALIEFWLLTETEADKNPVGEAQNEPNRDPFLRDPKRNPPPWAFGTRGLNALGRWKMIIMIALAAIIIAGVGVGLIIPLVAVAAG